MLDINYLKVVDLVRFKVPVHGLRFTQGGIRKKTATTRNQTNHKPEVHHQLCIPVFLKDLHCLSVILLIIFRRCAHLPCLAHILQRAAKEFLFNKTSNFSTDEPKNERKNISSHSGN